MKRLEKISEFIVKYMAVIVLLTALISLFFPEPFFVVKTSYINFLLMIIMFGMGLTLKSKDFVLIFSHPREIFLGSAAQYIVMPLIAFGLSKLFNLDLALTAGVILVGTCPGGTASNVITYLSKGDIALSVCMTSVNTLIAPILTPFITYMLLKTTVRTDVAAMFFGIIQVIIVPIIFGVVMNKFFGSFTQKIVKVLPSVSVISICIIIASVVSHNSSKIFAAVGIILVVVILHNILGYLFGFFIGKLMRLNSSKIKAFSIEIGMQNSGLATALAGTAFPALPEAAVPGALFSVWHNISGAILAAIYKNWHENDDMVGDITKENQA